MLYMRKGWPEGTDISTERPRNAEGIFMAAGAEVRSAVIHRPEERAGEKVRERTTDDRFSGRSYPILLALFVLSARNSTRKK
jgi:hypothetical protein